MALFRKKNDPISERARALQSEIAALETQIKHLNSRIQDGQASQPRVRSTVHRAHPEADLGPPPTHSGRPLEPIFESVDHEKVASASATTLPGISRSELGVRDQQTKNWWQRFKNQFRAPPASNPKLVNYLAAGSIKGLRPLRYEKRVARNRFLALFILFLLLLWGIIAALERL